MPPSRWVALTYGRGMTSDPSGTVPSRTHAVGYHRSGPIDAPGALVDVEVPLGAPGPHDLVVEVRAVSVNPVDTKIRSGVDPTGSDPRVIGWDAAGVVLDVGSDVTAFAVGDEVFYAGSLERSGSNAEVQLVDEHLVGHKPSSVGFAEAAALPLTAITAWETLFDRLGLGAESTGTLLVVGAAGGVGSMVVQLARALTGLTVVGTASRPESREWVLEQGAHHVVDHHGDLVAGVREVAPLGVDHVFTSFSTPAYVEAFADLLVPRGAVVAIDDPEGLDLMPLKPKSLTWHWEFMFTRALMEPDSWAQHELLEQVARLVDDGTLRTTLTTELTGLSAEVLTQAHRLLESSATIGKVVVTVRPEAPAPRG